MHNMGLGHVKKKKKKKTKKKKKKKKKCKPFDQQISTFFFNLVANFANIMDQDQTAHL